MKGIYSPKMLELSDVRHVKASMTKKARSQFVMFTFLSASKRSRQKTQTVTWTFDCLRRGTWGFAVLRCRLFFCAVLR